jgi:hypothetical protein
MQTISPIPIVLTGTIAPNQLADAVRDPQVRKTEYLQAIDFYSPFSERIFFLENSSYPLRKEIAFSQFQNLHLRELPTSKHPERGKGFQEFEMLDMWMATESLLPACWLKISGRYIIRNIGEILEECGHETRASLIIDQNARSCTARTQIFYAASEPYLRTLKDIYRECDDRAGHWIERALFKALKKNPEMAFRFFKHRPDLVGRSGTTGEEYPASALGRSLKQILRTGNRLFDKQYLWFSR